MMTLKNLAKELKVSISTVSKALRDSPEISTETIEKVKDLAKLFERLIVQDHLYSEERIVEMKEALSAIKKQITEMEKQNYKGFGA